MSGTSVVKKPTHQIDSPALLRSPWTRQSTPDRRLAPTGAPPILSGVPSSADIRGERPGDEKTIFDVQAKAFGREGEARLVDRLRAEASPIVSLVATLADGVVGHVMFSPVTIHEEARATRALGMAPVGVLPAHQRSGIGQQLVRDGLEACKSIGEHAVFVLGHVSYYPRFGFAPAWERGFYYRSPGPNPAFMVIELEAGALPPGGGEVRYHPVFDELEE